MAGMAPVPKDGTPVNQVTVDPSAAKIGKAPKGRMSTGQRVASAPRDQASIRPSDRAGRQALSKARKARQAESARIRGGEKPLAARQWKSCSPRDLKRMSALFEAAQARGPAAPSGSKSAPRPLPRRPQTAFVGSNNHEVKPGESREGHLLQESIHARVAADAGLRPSGPASASASNSEDLKALMKAAGHCNKVMAEVVSTEGTYQKGLQELVQPGGESPLQKMADFGEASGILNREEVQVLREFQAAASDALVISQQMMRDLSPVAEGLGDKKLEEAPHQGLESRLQGTRDALNSLTQNDRLVGAYTKLSAHYSPILGIVSKLKSEGGKEWSSLEGSFSKEVQSRGLPHFLIMPTQRSPRWQMLANELGKKAPAGNVGDGVRKLGPAFQGLAGKINEGTGHIEDERKMESLIRRLGSGSKAQTVGIALRIMGEARLDPGNSKLQSSAEQAILAGLKAGARMQKSSLSSGKRAALEEALGQLQTAMGFDDPKVLDRELEKLNGITPFDSGGRVIEAHKGKVLVRTAEGQWSLEKKATASPADVDRANLYVQGLTAGALQSKNLDGDRLGKLSRGVKRAVTFNRASLSKSFRKGLKARLAKGRAGL